MCEFEIIDEAAGWANDGRGSVDIIHKTDASKDLCITKSNCDLSDEEIIKIYAYCQSFKDVVHVSAYRKDGNTVISFSQDAKEKSIDELPDADVPEIQHALNQKTSSIPSWVASLKKAARDGKYVCIRDALSPKQRVEYADLFKKNFENWAKASRTEKMVLSKYDYNSICYVGPNNELEADRNALINPLLKGRLVATGSAKSDFAERLTEVLAEGNLDYVEIDNRFECNGVMICTFNSDECKKMQSALPKSFSAASPNPYIKTICFKNFKDFDIGKSDEDKFKAFQTAWMYNRSDVAAQIIKENPDLLLSEPMKKKLSPYDELNPHSATGEYKFEYALKMIEQLKYLQNQGAITDEQFKAAVNTQSPVTGETFLTHAIKLAVQQEGKSPYYGKNYLAVIDKALAMGLDCNIANARGQYPLELIEKAKEDVPNSKPRFVFDKNQAQAPDFSELRQIISERTSSITKVRMKMPAKSHINILNDENAPKIKADISYNAGDVTDVFYPSKTWFVKADQPSYLASDIKQPTDVARILPKGDYVISENPSEHITSMREFAAGKRGFYVQFTTMSSRKGKKVPAEKISEQFERKSLNTGNVKE